MTGVVCDLCDHPLLTVLLEEGVPGGPAHGRGGVQTVRQTQHCGQVDMEQQENNMGLHLCISADCLCSYLVPAEQHERYNVVIHPL